MESVAMDPIRDGRPIAGFPAYRVTPDGNIWSAWRWNGRARRYELSGFKLMKFGSRTQSYKGRYRRVVLIDEQRKRHSHNIHKLILEAFVGPCPEGMMSCHNNGDSFDNRVENLRWGTNTDNQRDRLKHGTACEGEDHYLTNLTNEKVTQIRKEYSEGSTQRQLARKYGVVRGTIAFITQGKTWKHLLKENENERTLKAATV